MREREEGKRYEREREGSEEGGEEKGRKQKQTQVTSLYSAMYRAFVDHNVTDTNRIGQVYPSPTLQTCR